MQVPELTIDPNLQNWVLFPMALAMILFTVFRQQLTAFLTSSPAKRQPLSKLKENENLRRTSLFKRYSWNFPKDHFKAKQKHLVLSLSSGLYLAEPKKDPDAQPSLDASTDNMMAMMRNSFGGMISQFAMMQFVNFFFTGYVLMKLPFPLTFKFKQMLQAGVNTSELDVRWVSAISFYFIATLGLNSIFNIFGVEDAAPVQQGPQGMMPQQPASVPQPEKIMEQEAKDVKIISHEWILDDVEDRVMKLYAK